MSIAERETFTPEEAKDFRFPDTASERYSEADASLINTMREEGSAILQKPADQLSASEMGVLLLASEQAEITQENRALKERIDQLEQLLYTDALTELKNRHYLQTLLEQDSVAQPEQEQERRHLKEGEPITAVLLIDLNGFKRINDTYGHEAGDVALQTVAETIRHTLRAEDNAVALPENMQSDKIRSGGDEFIVLLHNILPEDVENVVVRIHDAITNAQFTVTDRDNNEIQESVGAAIGVKMHRTGNSLKNDIKEADQAMYAAKEKGKAEIEPRERTIAIAPDFAQEVEGAQKEG